MDNSNKTKAVPSHYIGIGASAGGLEALQEFFSHLPSDTGAAYVVVQHLSPDFKSMMPELLAKHTTMTIKLAEDGQELEPNHLYLMPPRKNMLITEGTLQLSDQMPDSHVHMPIDIFMRSLAEDQQHKAIGVVLSGTGSDSSRGVKALKEAGGLVIVQEPSSAKFDGMPISASNTGFADLILPATEMGEALVEYINHPTNKGEKSILRQNIEGGDDASYLEEIFKLLKNQSSINFSEYKASTVARRIERRISLNKLDSLEDYYRLLRESSREMHILCKELLIGVTRFFRDTEAFKKLMIDIVPKAIEKAEKSKEAVRVWVAGCSTGEEAYSMAILLDEYMQRSNLSLRVKIFATDVDEEAIAEASAGKFPPEIVQDVSEERMSKYFTKTGDHYEVTSELRQMVIFATHNMIDDPPFSNIDIVSCRNVLIYFQQSAQRKVLAALYFALRRDGYLFLGSSESLGDLQSHFEVISERLRLYRKVSNARFPIASAPLSQDNLAASRTAMAIAPQLGGSKSVKNSSSPLTAVQDRLIVEYAPDCIVVNESFDAVHVYGDVSDYTKGVVAGSISNNIKDMVVEDLNVAVSTALFRCEKNDEDVYYKDIVINKKNDEQILLDLTIFCAKSLDVPGAPRFFIVQFTRRNEAEARSPKKISFDANEQSRQRIMDLELELVKKQEHLQVTIEELETTNEELQSANEELMSANEELQSTNEELQSVNEELYTVNTEYQEKIVQLTEVNSDLNSVMDSTEIGLVFLDEQLTIRKFTKSITQYVNVRDADIGRPFHHISHDLLYDDMLADIAKVSTGNEPVEKDVLTKQDHSLLVRIMPYHKLNSRKSQGVLLTITNISRLRFVETALQRAQEKLRNSLLDRAERLHRRINSNQDIKVLLLDDSSADRRNVMRLLSEVHDRAFNITACAEIHEAMEVVTKNKFDICLVDFRLSDGTAKDFTQKMREAFIDTPVVILSGYSEDGLDAEFLANDIFDFLNKDELSTQLLVRSIDYVLERKDVKEALDDL